MSRNLRNISWIGLIFMWVWHVHSLGAQTLPQLAHELDSLSIFLLDQEPSQLRGREKLKEALVLFEKMSAMDGFADYPFEELRAFMQVTSLDQEVRIFTCFAYVAGARVYYGGVYLRSSNKWIPLDADQDGVEFTYFEKECSNPEDWYGALYYDIKPFKHKRKTYYVLFGQRTLDAFQSAKLLDILDPDGEECLMGAPFFKDDSKDVLQNRLFIPYASEAPISLRFDPLEDKIVFDHVIPMKSMYDPSKVVMVPDGSYSAYKLKRGLWHFEDKLPVKPMDEAPRHDPVLDRRKNRDILGRPTEKNANTAPQEENR